jgi:hypothetical protein
MSSNDNVIMMYGIWIPGKGWLRGKDDMEYCDTILTRAKQVSKLIGLNSQVRFLDLSIVDFEQKYLEQERKTLWHQMKLKWSGIKKK